MANKIVKSNLKHYYDEGPVYLEPDKTKSISELNMKELSEMINRLGSEKHLQEIIKELKRNSGERNSYDQPLKVDTKTPINQLYHEELSHYGVLGQKWGVRRYQNKDGTRTAAGKKREREVPDSKTKKSKESKKNKTRKSTDQYSNEELKKLNERLQLEETYKRLTKDDVQKGESWVSKSIKDARGQALTEFSKGVMLGSAKLFVKEISPEFAEVAFKIKDKDKKD